MTIGLVNWTLLRGRGCGSILVYPAFPFVLSSSVMSLVNSTPQVLLSTDLTLTPEQILAFFMSRWQMEPTFRHVREHLGVETQRQWSDKAIARTTPFLLGLFSFITLVANALVTRHDLTVHTSAWYPKVLPTFSDALALVRYQLWAYFTFQMSSDDADMIKVPRVLLERFHDLLCYAT